ncbi:RTA1 domain-containing protein [Corynespora cassiicola Philippines]|uniref:RTA1 domain-containing protein n=1 Tax=Corynespora cassiicola Philippines TaxID=1448308 RepID=A0A2T2NHW1_CORCC|nr:RTA1 domain-containing protein [Corynespora cassiicola Philippines]
MAPTLTSLPAYNLLFSRADALVSTCTTAKPGRYGHVSDYDACNAYFPYHPSLPAAFMFAISFAVVLMAHVIQGMFYRKVPKRFTWVVIMGAVWECGSFIARTISTRHQQEVSLIAISQLLFLLAPVWINAFVHMILARLIYFYHPDRCIFGIDAPRISTYFVWADILSFLIQAGGGSLLGPEQSAKEQDIGFKLYMGGVSLQQVLIICFLVLAVKFQIDMYKSEGEGSTHYGRIGWQKQVWCIYCVLGLITLRIIYRLVEFADGLNADGTFMKHEYYIYILDALPMFLALLLLSLYHPGKVLLGPDSEFPKLTKREKQEAKRRSNKGQERLNSPYVTDVVPLTNIEMDRYEGRGQTPAESSSSRRSHRDV